MGRSHAHALELFSLEAQASVRCFHTSGTPGALRFLDSTGGGPVLAACESHHVSGAPLFLSSRCLWYAQVMPRGSKDCTKGLRQRTLCLCSVLPLSLVPWV